MNIQELYLPILLLNLLQNKKKPKMPRMTASTCLGYLADIPNDDTIPTNAVMWLLVRHPDGWRVVMNVEKRRHRRVWGATGGKIDRGETSWKAAVRELREETGISFDKHHWDRKTEVKFTVNETRHYFNIYTGPVFKGDPHNKEVAWVEHVRLDRLITSILEGGKLLCGRFNLPLRRCMSPGSKLSNAFRETFLR